MAISDLKNKILWDYYLSILKLTLQDVLFKNPSSEIL